MFPYSAFLSLHFFTFSSGLPIFTVFLGFFCVPKTFQWAGFSPSPFLGHFLKSLSLPLRVVPVLFDFAFRGDLGTSPPSFPTRTPTVVSVPLFPFENDDIYRVWRAPDSLCFFSSFSFHYSVCAKASRRRNLFFRDAQERYSLSLSLRFPSRSSPEAI